MYYNIGPWKLGAVFRHQERGVVGLEPANEQQPVDVVLDERLFDSGKLSGRKSSFRAEFGPAGVRPSVDVLPRERSDVAGFESLDSVVDPERIVSGDDAVPDE
jgi:hypothetical protein